YLDEHGLDQVGLFRVAGDQGEIQQLESAFQSAEDAGTVMEANASILTVPNVASLLKLWLRNLSVSLIPESSYSRMMSYANTPDTLVAKVSEEISSWPRAHLVTLRLLLCFLTKVAKESEVNKMSAENLAIVFSPTILKAPEDMDPMAVMQNVQASIKVVALLIDKCRELFSEDDVEDAFAKLAIDDPTKPKRANKMSYGGAKRASAPVVPSAAPPPVPRRSALGSTPPPVPGSSPPPIPGAGPPPVPPTRKPPPLPPP
ncbi:hypothetical protein TeGR_g4472, partial [Tetraparma gracilis]